MFLLNGHKSRHGNYANFFLYFLCFWCKYKVGDGWICMKFLHGGREWGRICVAHRAIVGHFLYLETARSIRVRKRKSEKSRAALLQACRLIPALGSSSIIDKLRVSVVIRQWPSQPLRVIPSSKEDSITASLYLALVWTLRELGTLTWTLLFTVLAAERS